MTFAHLWNDMPLEERERLYPYMTETHVLHLKQVRTMIIDAHKAELRKLDGWIAILENQQNATKLTAEGRS
jgi:hypothetical protein